jgi:ribosomal protein L17
MQEQVVTHPHLSRIDEWIAVLEQKAKRLLDDLEIDAEEMKPKERLDAAVKLVTLAQRYMVLRQQRETGAAPSRNTILLTLMKQMRGELEAPSAEDE